MSTSQIIPEMVYKIHYIEKFLYSLKKFEKDLALTLEGLKPTGLQSRFCKIPIHFDIKDILTAKEFLVSSKLYDLKTQFELSKSTDQKAILFGKEIEILREKCKDFIVKSFVLKFHYEIFHYQAMRVWKDQKFEEEDTPDFSIPPTESIRKISN